MQFDFTKLPAAARYKLLTGTITPRPIAWVVTQNAAGQVNAAPYSFFNAFSADPPTVGIGMGNSKPGQAKDSLVNIRETKQFVINLVDEANAEAMNITATEFPYGVDELARASLTTLPAMANANKFYVDTPKLKLIGRTQSPSSYIRTHDHFEIDRISLSDWEKQHQN